MITLIATQDNWSLDIAKETWPNDRIVKIQLPKHQGRHATIKTAVDAQSAVARHGAARIIVDSKEIASAMPFDIAAYARDIDRLSRF